MSIKLNKICLMLLLLPLSGWLIIERPFENSLARWFDYIPHLHEILSFLVLLLSSCILLKRGDKKYTCILGKLKWDRNAFCRGWLITGSTGSGKTQCGINILMHQVFQNESGQQDSSGNFSEHPWGGICIDEKGLYWQTLKDMSKHYNREKDLVLLQTRPDGVDHSWRPKFCFNLLSNDKIPANTYASAIVNTSASVAGGSGDKGFFRTQAESNIGWAIELLRSVGRCQAELGFRAIDWTVPTLKLVLQILTDKKAFTDLLQEIEVISDQLSDSMGHNHKISGTKDGGPKGASDKLKECIDHFENRYWSQPPDQLGGVQGTIYNYLNYFSNDDVAEVFCSHNTFEFDAIDLGKIICVAMPQKLQIERRYVCTLLKLLFYHHVLCRFDKPKENFDKKNLLICWQDEAQRFVTEADGNVDVIREAGATTILACQSQTSLFPALGGKDKGKVIILNLRNRLIFRSSDEDCAQASAEFIGKIEKVSRQVSYSRQGQNVTVQKRETYKVSPSKLRQMKDFSAIVCHSDGPVKKYKIMPKTPQNRLPQWKKTLVPRFLLRDFATEKLS